MADCMNFPATVEEFMEQYKITDTEQVYTNGAELIPMFRMKQWFEHLTDTNVGNINYIRIQDLIDALSRLMTGQTMSGYTWMYTTDVYDAIASLPFADVAPVVHSYWEGEETDCNIKCHKCEKAFKDYIITQDYADLNEYPNFCPNCGAKMEENNG